QVALAQFIFELMRIRGEIAIRAEFNPGVASFDHLIQETVPWNLLWVIGEPHTPGVRCGADAQAGVVASDRGGFGAGRYRSSHCFSYRVWIQSCVAWRSSERRLAEQRALEGLLLEVFFARGVGGLERGSFRNWYVPPPGAIRGIDERVGVDVNKRRLVGSLGSSHGLFEVVDGIFTRVNFNDVEAVAARIHRQVNR